MVEGHLSTHSISLFSDISSECLLCAIHALGQALLSNSEDVCRFSSYFIKEEIKSWWAECLCPRALGS